MAHVSGLLITAAYIGYATQSLLGGLLAAAMLYALSVHSGVIRPDGAPPSPPRRRRRH